MQVTGGGDQDPVVRVTSTIGSLGEHLDRIQMRIAEAMGAERSDAWLDQHLARLDSAVAKLSSPSEVRVEVQNQAPKELEAALLPLVRSSAQNLEEVRSLTRPLLELIELMKLNALSDGASNGHGLRAGTEPEK